MKAFHNKVILKKIEPKKDEDAIVYEDKDEVKLGKVHFPFKGDKAELKKGDEVYYQYGTDIKIEGDEYVLVSEGNLICQK